jgi:hypothetical protein
MTERRDRDERVSLHGLDPEEAVRALLAVKPDNEAATHDVEKDPREGGGPPGDKPS